jgi:predicted HAD superfamily hydrolase
MTEQEYVVGTFYEHFSSYKSKNIALYGLGIHTRMILEALPELSFKALLDGYRSDGEMYGKPIIPMDCLIDWNIDVVIIVARPGSVKIIYKRISEFCIMNGIKVYDMTGNELTREENEEDIINSDFKLCIDDVKQAIREHEIISFDIFNTLLARKTYQSQDVFHLVQKQCAYNKIDFVKERTQAERELTDVNPTLEDIYSRIKSQTGITAAEASSLMQTEKKIEKEILICRESMKELLNYAVSLDKQVYLISDMYLTRSLIQNILTSHGIEGYKDIFVSCEYHTGKRQELYKVFKNQVKGSSYLHLGDDEQVDGTFAKLNGLDYILIDSPSEMISKSSYRTLLKQTDTYENHIQLGLLTSNLFNDPFCLHQSGGRPVIRSAYQLGYIFIAPALSNFVLWLIDHLKRKHYSHILFLARDGYLIKQLYDEAVRIIGYQKELPESVYFLTSRFAAISATATTDEHIEYAAGLSFDGTPEDLLKKRFFLRYGEFEQYDDKKYRTPIEYILNHSDKVKYRADELRGNYQRYIKGLQIKQNEKLAFFDFVSTGTCQMCIEELIGEKMDGYYFIRMSEEYHRKKQLSILSYYDFNTLYNQNSSVADNYFFLESIIKSLEPSISYFDCDGDPVYQQESRTKEQIEFIKEVQNGVNDFLKEYLYMIRGSQIHIDKSYADKTLELMQNKYSFINITDLKHSIIRDEFCNRDIDLGTYIL